MCWTLISLSYPEFIGFLRLICSKQLSLSFFLLIFTLSFIFTHFDVFSPSHPLSSLLSMRLISNLELFLVFTLLLWTTFLFNLYDFLVKLASSSFVLTSVSVISLNPITLLKDTLWLSSSMISFSTLLGCIFRLT